MDKYHYNLYPDIIDRVVNDRLEDIDLNVFDFVQSGKLKTIIDSITCYTKFLMHLTKGGDQ
jgi:hypothetical protein